MPNWITNELKIAGPKGPVETLDAELWDREQAAKDGNGLRFDVAVPAVPADTEWIPGYPGGDFGEKAWGCRAVSHAGRHERIVTESTQAWLDAHPYLFYFGLEDFAYNLTGDTEAWLGSADQRAAVIDEAAPGRAAPTAIIYRFDTAYNPPEPFVEKLARRYPHLYLGLTWQGEVPDMHGMSVHAPRRQDWPVNGQPAMPPEAMLDPELAEAARRTPPPYAAARDIHEGAGVLHASAP